eukprot:TRINITY_DN4252_c0_g3_i2.p1 TRINITY_DN4252_c0_g3~~TRINITY_DN4252_c0_g3_i2.p1  ORF type:complete len:316 (-),score=-39.41 TRINITY_DN4252_c0_g3_i2:366-1313(-)
MFTNTLCGVQVTKHNLMQQHRHLDQQQPQPSTFLLRCPQYTPRLQPCNNTQLYKFDCIYLYKCLSYKFIILQRNPALEYYIYNNNNNSNYQIFRVTYYILFRIQHVQYISKLLLFYFYVYTYNILVCIYILYVYIYTPLNSHIIVKKYTQFSYEYNNNTTSVGHTQLVKKASLQIVESNRKRRSCQSIENDSSSFYKPQIRTTGIRFRTPSNLSNIYRTIHLYLHILIFSLICMRMSRRLHPGTQIESTKVMLKSTIPIASRYKVPFAHNCDKPCKHLTFPISENPKFPSNTRDFNLGKHCQNKPCHPASPFILN